MPKYYRISLCSCLACSLLNLDQGYDEEWGTFGARPSQPSTSDASSRPSESPRRRRSSGTRPSKSEASSIREGSPYPPPDTDGASPAAFGDLPRTHPHLFRESQPSGELPDALPRGAQQSAAEQRWASQPAAGPETNSGLSSPFAEPHAQHAALQDAFQPPGRYVLLNKPRPWSSADASKGHLSMIACSQARVQTVSQA